MNTAALGYWNDRKSATLDEGEFWCVIDIETEPDLEAAEAVRPDFAALAREAAIGNRKDPEKIAQFYADKEIELRLAWQSRLALSPFTGRMVALLVGKPGYSEILFADEVAGGEKALVQRAIWHIAREKRVIGHNITGFDIPFVLGRAWIHGLDVPPGAMPDWRGYFPARIWDTCAWTQKIFGERFRLDRLCQIFGLPTKPLPPGEKNSANFGQWPRDVQREYAEHDLRVTTEVARRMGLIGFMGGGRAADATSTATEGKMGR